jgi:hypothetical protein
MSVHIYTINAPLAYYVLECEGSMTFWKLQWDAWHFTSWLIKNGSKNHNLLYKRNPSIVWEEAINVN